MVTQITDDVSCIRIQFDAQVFLINKTWIRSIETVQTDTVKLDIGAGPLRHVYVRFSEVTVPAGLADVNALRDAIEQMLDTSPNQNETNALKQVLATLQKMMSTNGINLNAPSVTDESVPNIVYYGYASQGGATSQPTWAINQVTSNKGIVTSLWANGNASFSNIWDNRYTLKYELLGTAAAA